MAESGHRLHSLLHNQGVTSAKHSELTRAAAREKLVALLRGNAAKEAARILRNIAQIDESLAEINVARNAELQKQKEYAQLALSIPGIGDQAAFTPLAFLAPSALQRAYKNAAHSLRHQDSAFFQISKKCITRWLATNAAISERAVSPSMPNSISGVCNFVRAIINHRPK